jgi:hypothetical protein
MFGALVSTSSVGGSGRLVDETAARDVDDERGLLHRLQLGGADHAGRLGRLRHVDRDEVARAEQLVERQQGRPELLGTGLGDVRVVGDDVDAERLQPRGDQRADAAEADDADPLLVELDARVLRALPLSGCQRGVRGGDVPRERQDVADRQLGGADDVGGRGVDDHHAGGRRGGDVDVVEPDPGTGDHLEQRSGGDRLGVDLGRRADEHGVGGGEGREQSGPVGSVDVADVEVGSQRVDRRGGEFFGDEHNRLGHAGFLPGATGSAPPVSLPGALRAISTRR